MSCFPGARFSLRLKFAARYYLRTDWELDAEALHDDFKPAELEAATKRHNRTCVRDCRYSNSGG